MHKKFIFTERQFFAKGETVCGEQQVAFSEGGILWNGNLYRELTFTPQDEHASFSLYDVTIGINFHWERQETQSFMGTLKLVVDEGKSPLSIFFPPKTI